MQNNSFSMKRIVLTVSLCLGFLFFSCENQVDRNNNEINQKEETPITSKNKKATEIPVATKKADTVINGKQIYRFGGEAKKDAATKRMTANIEDAIKNFEYSVIDAKSCEDLIKACRDFDYDVKALSDKDKSINVINIENRTDVIAIRKMSEEKSLSLCQTSKITK